VVLVRPWTDRLQGPWLILVMDSRGGGRDEWILERPPVLADILRPSEVDNITGKL
jgi:hypothetical protein